MNIAVIRRCERRQTRQGPGAKPRPESYRRRHAGPELLYFDRFHHHELAHGAAVLELDSAGDFGKQRVVLAAAHVQPRLNARATLPHDDGSARYQLTAERLEPKPLRIRIAAVS